MKQGFNSLRFMNLLGGLNDSSADTAVADNQFVKMLNMTVSQIGKYGRIQKRQGKVKYVSSTVNGAYSIQGLYDFIRREDDNKRLLAVSNGSVMYDAGGTWTAVQTGLSTTEKFTFCEYINQVLFGNSVDGIYKWDGITAASKITAAPAFKGIMTYKNHIFGYGVSDYQYTLYWSELGDIDTWPATQIINFDENITGIGSLPNVLAVFTENTMWYITGSDSDDFARVQMNSETGCVSGRTICEINNNLYFLAKDGVYTVSMTGVPEKISGNIDKAMAEINATFYEECCAVHDKQNHRYILSAPTLSSPTNNRLYIYDYVFKAWTVEDHACAALVCSEEVDGRFKVLSGNYSGYVYKHYTSGNDDGTAITSYVETKWIDAGDPTNIHNFKWMNVYYYPVGEHTLTIKVYTDWDESSYETFTFVMRGDRLQIGTDWYLDGDELYSDNEIAMEIVPIFKRGNSVKIRFEQSVANNFFALYGFELLERQCGSGNNVTNQS